MNPARCRFFLAVGWQQWGPRTLRAVVINYGDFARFVQKRTRDDHSNFLGRRLAWRSFHCCPVQSTARHRGGIWRNADETPPILLPGLIILTFNHHRRADLLCWHGRQSNAGGLLYSPCLRHRQSWPLLIISGRTGWALITAAIAFLLRSLVAFYQPGGHRCFC